MGSIKEHRRRHGDIRGSRTWQVHNLLTNKFCPLWLTSNHSSS
jgi:hypothetical protein